MLDNDMLVTRRVVERTTRYEQRLDIQSNESQSSLVKTTYMFLKFVHHLTPSFGGELGESLQSTESVDYQDLSAYPMGK